MDGPFKGPSSLSFSLSLLSPLFKENFPFLFLPSPLLSSPLLSSSGVFELSITQQMVAETASLNEEFLGLSFPKLKMLRIWATNSEPIYKELDGFEKRINELADEYLNDPVKAMDVLLQEMRERRREIEKEK